MASGWLFKDRCFTDEGTLGSVFCGVDHPKAERASDGSANMVITTCAASPGASVVDGYLGVTLSTRSVSPSGSTVSSSYVNATVQFPACDTDVDYAGGLALITKADAVTVAWGIVIAWIAAAAVVWMAKQFRG